MLGGRVPEFRAAPELAWLLARCVRAQRPTHGAHTASVLKQLVVSRLLRGCRQHVQVTVFASLQRRRRLACTLLPAACTAQASSAMNAYARSGAHASTSGRPCRAYAPCKRAPAPLRKRSPACAAAQKPQYAPSEKETAEIEAIARGFEARLSRLHAEAPDDDVLQDMTEATMQWDDDELASEGAALQSSTALELPDPEVCKPARVLPRVFCPPLALRGLHA